MMTFYFNRDAWDAKCKRCGLCCHEKVVVGSDVIIDLDAPCEHFNVKTRLCEIYTQRLKLNGRCRRLTPWRAMFARYLHDECAYVQWAKENRIRFALKRNLRLLRGSRTACDTDSDPSHSLLSTKE